MTSTPAPVRRADGRVYVEAGAMRRLVAAIFEREGCEPREAAKIAASLAGANLRGHDSHGVIRTPRYVELCRDGWVVANQRVDVVSETDSLAILDGKQGFGQSIGGQAVEIGVEKSRRHGVAVTALRNAGHLGRIGEWAELAAEQGCASLHMVNVRGSLMVAPFGGTERRGGTSPFCAGVPVPGGEPIVHDFATALVAEGKALIALRGGPPLPDGALVSADGTLTSDPAPLYGDTVGDLAPNPRAGPGALTGFGLHKGSGLNFFMEMFAGALTGSGTSGALGDERPRVLCNGMLSLYMNLEHFQTGEWYANEVRAYVEFWKSARPITEGGEVLVPGEKESRTMAERLVTGLPLSEAAWSDILGATRLVGMDAAAVEAALGGAP